MLGVIEVAPLAGHNIDDALALLHTVVPPRPSLRQALLAEGGGGFVATQAGQPVLAVAATTQRGDATTTWVRIAGARPRDTRRWLEAVPLASSPLCRSPYPVECTIADWEHGAAAHLVTLGLRRGGRTCYMTSRERHELPQVELAPVTEAVVRACFELDRAAELHHLELRSSDPEPSVDEVEAYREFAAMAASFAMRGDLFAFRVDGAVRAYLLLDDNAIDSIAVSPEVQRRGIGSMIVRFACATLERRGHDLVSLLTVTTNLEAIRLYERHGFRMHSINQWFVRQPAVRGL
jgi:ribosomal protein S18 acetylase RimI-like enzyme